MFTRNTEAHRSAHQHWKRGDFRGAVRDMVPNFTYVDHANGLELKSRDEFEAYIASWKHGFSDVKMIKTAYHDGGTTSIAQCVAEGTNDGQFGEHPATGRRATIVSCELIHFDAEGRMTSGDIYYDRMSVLEQLGHVEAGAK